MLILPLVWGKNYLPLPSGPIVSSNSLSESDFSYEQNTIRKKIENVKKRTKIGVVINCIFDVHNKIKTPSTVMRDVKRTMPKKQVTQCGRENKHSSQTN